MAKVSVIIPVYNAEKYLSKCLTSIANQTLKDIEIIAINDGSKDTSLDILDSFSSHYNGEIKIIEQSNSGAGAARNAGLDVATGEFIKFVDADDYLKLDILEKMYTTAKGNNVELVRGNYQTMIGPIHFMDTCSWSGLKGNQLVDVEKNKDYIITETSGIGNKLIGRKLLGDLRFPEKTKWEDLAIMPVVVAGSKKLFHMDEPVYNYRVNMNTTIKDFINKIPNILDIISCLDYLVEQMRMKNLDKEYQEQIESLYILHTLFRVENAMTWINLSKAKKTIVIQNLINIIELKYPYWRSNRMVQKYREANPLFNFDMTRLDSYLKTYEPLSSKEEIEAKIVKVFK